MAIINGTPADETLTGTIDPDSMFGLAGKDTLWGGDGNDTQDGGFGTDSLYGQLGNDSLNGGGGEDSLYGDNGNDTLNGAAGDDYLEGNQGTDTYILTKAGGQDRIANYDSDSSVDIAKFNDVATTDITELARYGNDLILKYGVAGGQLTVENYFYSDSANYRLDTFDFTNADWTVTQIKNQVITKGTEFDETIYGYNAGPNQVLAYGGNDTVYGGDGNDNLDGGVGNDYLRGYDGNDTLLGQSGSDQLYGDNGSDTLNGGTGDDYLEGNQGADTYILTKAGGQDRIANYDSDSSADIAKFNDVATTDITELARYGNDLILKYGAAGGQLTVENYFYSDSANYRLDTFDFTNADWTVTQIKNQVITKGTDLNETIYGYNAGPNQVLAYGGNDTVYGGDGNDNLDGGIGNDYLRGYDGNDTLLGQSGKDQLYGDNGNDILNGGAGDDYLEGNQGTDTYILTKAGGQDRIANYDSDSSADIAKFNDVATTDITELTRYGNDLILKYGAAGGQLTVENYFYSDSANYRLDTFDFTNADWTVTQIKNQVITKGTDLNETIYGYNAGPNQVLAYGGNDTVYGGDGNDNLDGGAGKDYLNGYDGNDTLLGQNGADQLYGSNGGDTLNGGTGDDYLEGNQGADTYVIAKNDGHDVIYNYDSDSAFDKVQFSNLTLRDISGANRISNDFVLSYGAANQVTVRYHFSSASYEISQYVFADGATIDKIVMGTTGNDALVGTAANDFIVGAGGVDSMTGLAGNDAYLTDGGDSIVEAAGGGTDTVLSSVTYTLGANLEALVLLDGAVNGTGNGANNSLYGNAADNTLTGLAGNDLLDGGAGADAMEGGAGNDTYVRDNAGDVITEAANQGTDTVQSSTTYSLALNVENLTLTGAGAINGTGNTLANILIGNNASNNLNGATNNDTLFGKAGNDILTGGGGADLFQFDTDLNAATNVDQVTDFVSVDDTIVLENAIFGKFVTVGAIQPGEFVIGSAASDANDYLIYNNVNGNILYDADGNGAGAAVHFATLTGTPSLVAADFLIV